MAISSLYSRKRCSPFNLAPSSLPSLSAQGSTREIHEVYTAIMNVHRRKGAKRYSGGINKLHKNPLPDLVPLLPNQT